LSAFCGIEQHAVLYALLVKEAIERFGKAGEKAACDATARYGRERGARMAQRAIANGDDLTLPNFRLYKEWRAPKEGLMEHGAVTKSPSYTFTVTRCEWNESWRKHGLIEYGKMYCSYVDRYLYKGWSEQYELIIHKLLSTGDDICSFDWGFEMTPEIETYLDKKRASYGDRYARDFDYHAGHVLHALCSEFSEQLGAEKSAEIRKAALKQFEEKFGKECVQALLAAFPQQNL
jgi:hypothetical protein